MLVDAECFVEVTGEVTGSEGESIRGIGADLENSSFLCAAGDQEEVWDSVCELVGGPTCAGGNEGEWPAPDGDHAADFSLLSEGM